MSHIPAGRARSWTVESTSLSASPHSLGRLWNTASSSLLFLNIQACAEHFEAVLRKESERIFQGQTKPDLTAFYSKTSGCVDKRRAVDVVYFGKARSLTESPIKSFRPNWRDMDWIKA